MTKKFTQDEFIQRCVAKHGARYDYSQVVYKTKDEKVTIICPDHGSFDQAANNHIRGQGCPLCKGEKISAVKRKNALPSLHAWILSRNSGYEYDIDTFTTFLSPMRIVCNKHGDFWQTPGNHFHQDQGCPKCFSANKTSTGEQELYDYVKSLAPDAENRNRKVISPKEIDIFIPSRNIGIEYHGLHWHADDSENTSLRTKWQLCHDKGVRLIQIFEDEWLNRRHVVQDLIRATLGLRQACNARDLTICGIEKVEAKGFLEKWHIAGYSRSNHHYGAFKGDELVAVLTTSKPRFDQHDLEVVRFAASYHIRGGFRKIFKVILESQNPKSVVSYADLRFGTGNTYLDAGFKDGGLTPSDYWWFKKQERIPRYRTQKHKLKTDPRFSEFYSDDKTENQICVEAGYRKISGVGHRKLIWNANL